jgi:Domain of unknown function (DUF1707)
VITGPGDHRAAGAGGRGRLRASHADRERAIEVLKAAFVQGRLDKDELDARVGRAFASRTYAELAAVTADIPAEPAAVRPPRPAPARPQRPGNTTVKTGARVIIAATVLTAGVWAGALLSQADNTAVGTLVWIFTFTWLGIVCLVGAVMLESRQQERSGGQLPPRRTGGAGGQPARRSASAASARGLEGQPGRTGDDPAPPGAGAQAPHRSTRREHRASRRPRRRLPEPRMASGGQPS